MYDDGPLLITPYIWYLVIMACDMITKEEYKSFEAFTQHPLGPSGNLWEKIIPT